MHLDRRGDIGFAEAMTGTAVVCVVLGMFTVFAATMVSGYEETQRGFDWNLVNSVVIDDEGIEWGEGEEVLAHMEDRRLKGVSVTFDSRTGATESKNYEYGECDGLQKTCRHVVLSQTEDGRRVPLEVTVIEWS